MLRLFAIGLVALAACSWRARPDHSLELRAAELARLGAPAALIERLRSDPFAYFRMLAAPFERRVCAEFAEVRGELPITALEGDAHVEQFAATSSSYGLDDFDRGGFGPAVVDLVRYAASLHLTCQQVRFSCNADALVQRFLDRYAAALLAEPAPRQPRVVARLRQRVPSSSQAWRERLERSLSRLTPEDEAELRQIWSAYARGAGTTAQLVAIGGLHSGMGSTTSKRAMLRVSGDLLVEVRRGVTADHQSCVWRGPPNEAIALLVMSMLRREMPHLHGFVLGATPAWLQSWDATYVELSLRDLTTQADLEELVDDAAAQLAAPPATGLPGLLLISQRRAQLVALQRTRERVVALAATLARETTTAWQLFRRAAARE